MPVPPPDPAFEAVRSPAALEWLRSLGLPDETVHAITMVAPTWAELRALPATQWLSYARIPAPTVPHATPPPIPLPADVVRLSRYQMEFPAGLGALRHPPALLYCRGVLPQSPTLGVVCANYPTEHGSEVVKDAARAAAAANIVLVLRHGTTAGRAATLEAVRMGMPVVLVSDVGLDTFDADSALVDEVVELGGALVCVAAPKTTRSQTSTAQADMVLVGLSTAVLVAQAGLSVSSGVVALEEAVRERKFLIVPEPVETGFSAPAAAAAVPMLATPGAYDEQVLGTNADIERRRSAGMPAANAVVTHPQELAAVLAVALRHM